MTAVVAEVAPKGEEMVDWIRGRGVVLSPALGREVSSVRLGCTTCADFRSSYSSSIEGRQRDVWRSTPTAAQAGARTTVRNMNLFITNLFHTTS